MIKASILCPPTCTFSSVQVIFVTLVHFVQPSTITTTNARKLLYICNCASLTSFLCCCGVKCLLKSLKETFLLQNDNDWSPFVGLFCQIASIFSILVVRPSKKWWFLSKKVFICPMDGQLKPCTSCEFSTADAHLAAKYVQMRRSQETHLRN